MRLLPRVRTRAARLAAELAEVRAQAARAEHKADRAEGHACHAATRIDEVFGRMEAEVASAGLPRPRTRPALYVVGTEDRPGAA